MRKDIIITLAGLGEVYDKPINADLIRIWCNLLADLSPEELTWAVKSYVLDPKNVYFPKPGQLYGIARPTENKEEQASIVTDNIFAAGRSYGTDAFNENRAKMKIGDLGWSYIIAQGGWTNFVRSLQSEDDVPILKSQTRKSIMGLIQRGVNESARTGLGHVSLASLGIQMKELK